MITKIEINLNDVYDGLHIRCANSAGTWNDFLNNNKIVKIPYLEPCIMESSGNRFAVCNDPAEPLQSLKIPEQVATNISGNPYFDREATDNNFPKIDNLINNLSEEDKKVVEQVKEFRDDSRNMEVTINIPLICDWNGDPWNPELNVGEIDLDYRDVREQFVEVRYKAKTNALTKISRYKNILQKIANNLQISSYDVHRYIMEWI